MSFTDHFSDGAQEFSYTKDTLTSKAVSSGACQRVNLSQHGRYILFTFISGLVITFQIFLALCVLVIKKKALLFWHLAEEVIIAFLMKKKKMCASMCPTIALL